MKHPLGTKAARLKLANEIKAVCEKHGGDASVHGQLYNPQGLSLYANFGTMEMMVDINTLHRDCILLHWYKATRDLPESLFGPLGRNKTKATSQFGYDDAADRLDALLTVYRHLMT